MVIENLNNESRLIYKFSYINPLFLSHPLLLDWKLSNTVLITAYDVLKDEKVLTHLQQCGLTLKEYFHEMGFNKKIKILCDTGIFEYEARKARLDILSSGIHDFPVEDIFFAYQIINPDFLVSPDEIILQNHSKDEISSKIGIMIKNLDRMFDLFPKSKIVPVIQGFDVESMSILFQKIKDEKIQRVARGGLIPLWRDSKPKFRETIRLTELLAKDYGIENLHSFGLPNVKCIKDYFYDNNYSSLDTSILYYRTAQRKYLSDFGYFKSVRKAKFKYCGCEGCQLMHQNISNAYGADFPIGLYFHNCFTLNLLVHKLDNEPNVFEINRQFYTKIQKKQAEFVSRNDYSFNSAYSIQNTDRKIIYIHKKPNRIFKGKKFLILSSCSKNKYFRAKFSWSDLQTSEQRTIAITKEKNKLVAKRLYTGHQVQKLNNIVQEMRNIGIEVDYYFISAGFGLVHENKTIPSYDCSFTNKTDKEIKERSRELQIVQQLEKMGRYDLVFLALNDSYLKALDSNSLDSLEKKFDTNELVFFNSVTVMKKSIIGINEKELLEFDKKVNYFPYAIKSKIDVLKNFVLFLQNGIFYNFYDFMMNSISHENKYIYRAL